MRKALAKMQQKQNKKNFNLEDPLVGALKQRLKLGYSIHVLSRLLIAAP